MSYILEFTPIALADIEKHKKAGDKAVLRRIAKLLDEIKENPLHGVGRIELLKYGLAGKHSRRINQKHRIVYSVEDEIITVHVLSLWGITEISENNLSPELMRTNVDRVRSFLVRDFQSRFQITPCL